MQDKDFDRLMQSKLEQYSTDDFNPADWDKMEDRLESLNQPTANPQAPAKGFTFGAGKMGFAATMVLLTAVNVYLFTAKEDKTPATTPAATETVAQQQTVAVENNKSVETSNDLIEEPESTKPQALASTQENIAAAEPRSSKVVTKPASPVVNQEVTGQKETANPAAPVVPTKKVTKSRSQKSAGSSASQASGNVTSGFGAPSEQAGFNTGGLYAGKSPAGGAALASCKDHQEPELAFLILGTDTIRDNSITIKACDALNLKLVTASDAGHVLVQSNAAQVLENSSLVQQNTNRAAVLNWQPNAGHVRQQPYVLNLKLHTAECEKHTKAYQVAINVVAPVSFTLSGDTVVSKGEGANLWLSGADNASVKWLPADESISAINIFNPEVRPLKTTTYKVQVTAANGCTFTDSIQVRVKEQPQDKEAVFIPNIITPNNDGRNDYFEITTLEPGSYRLEVYNRWGRTVYSHDQYDNSWNAKGLPDGTYFYTITVRKTQQRYQGWIEVSY